MALNIIGTAIVSLIIISVCIAKVGNFYMNLQKWTILMVMLFYGLIFGMVFIFTYLGFNSPDYLEDLLKYSAFDFFVYLCSVLVLISGISLGFKLKTKSGGLINTNNSIFLDNTNNAWRKLTYFSIAMCIFSIISYYLYSIAYGGFSGLLNYTMAIRIGTSSIRNRLSFLQKFGGISTIAGFCLFSVFTNRTVNKKLKILSFFSWCVSFAFSLFVIYSQGGRGSLINALLVYILSIGFTYKTNLWRAVRKHWKKLILIPIAFIFMNSAWKRTEVTNFASLFSSGYSFLFQSFYVNIHANQFRFFQDLIIMPLMFLPSSIYMSLGITTANQFNTYLSQGGFKGSIVNGKLITGESTTGLLTFSYMQLGIIGVFIIGILFGVCVKKWNKRVENMANTPFKNMIYAYYIVYFIYNFVGGGDTSAMIISNFPYFLFFFLYGIYYKIRVKGGKK